MPGRLIGRSCNLRGSLKTESTAYPLSRRRGTTNRQAAFLADLQREVGLAYTGSGMTRGRATREIDRLVKLRDERSGYRRKGLEDALDLRLQRE